MQARARAPVPRAGDYRFYSGDTLIDRLRGERDRDTDYPEDRIGRTSNNPGRVDGSRLLRRRPQPKARGWRRFVLGRLGRAALARDDDTTIEEATTAGPSTVRPSLDLSAALEPMHRQYLSDLPVTRSDGVLLGLIRRDDAERASR